MFVDEPPGLGGVSPPITLSLSPSLSLSIQFTLTRFIGVHPFILFKRPLLQLSFLVMRSTTQPVKTAA